MTTKLHWRTKTFPRPIKELRDYGVPPHFTEEKVNTEIQSLGDHPGPYKELS